MTEALETRVLVIDDHPLFRKGVADLLDMGPALTLVGEAADGAAGLRLALEMRPDLILLDLNTKGLDGLETLRRLRADASLDARVVMLTVSDHEADVVAALRTGADGYLLKDMEPEEMLALLQDAMRGRLVISPQLTELIARALREGPAGPTHPDQAGLTDAPRARDPRPPRPRLQQQARRARAPRRRRYREGPRQALAEEARTQDPGRGGRVGCARARRRAATIALSGAAASP